uniref:Pollen-specific leucine-rich repeat extensin-like protein 1 n=1 Tax=Rhabditophanes sp. KR3021 TaxID=114890 RepID=A0AC35TRU9_9BILA
MRSLILMFIVALIIISVLTSVDGCFGGQKGLKVKAKGDKTKSGDSSKQSSGEKTKSSKETDDEDDNENDNEDDEDKTTFFCFYLEACGPRGIRKNRVVVAGTKTSSNEDTNAPETTEDLASLGITEVTAISATTEEGSPIKTLAPVEITESPTKETDSPKSNEIKETPSPKSNEIKKTPPPKSNEIKKTPPPKSKESVTDADIEDEEEDNSIL